MEQIITLKEPQGILKNASRVFQSIKKIDIDYSQENFIVLSLNAKNQVIASEVLFKGGLAACLIDPRTLFKKLLLNNAYCFIIAHNHPSGDLSPSKEDIDIFGKISRCGDLLCLKCLDSIIFNNTQFYSMVK